MLAQDKIKELLKKKGTGPTMGKSLGAEELSELEPLLQSQEVSDITKSTIMTAFLMLDPTPVEAEWLAKISANPQAYLPVQLTQLFFSGETGHPIVKLIRKVIAKNNLTRDEMDQAMKWVLDPTTPGYLKSTFLEAERLKRETLDENLGCFDALWSASRRVTANVPILLDLSVSYDGLNRSHPVLPFIAALLASIGYPAILHGVESVAPKKGITPYKILKAAGKNPLKSMDATVQDIENPQIGWGYCDQSVSFPELNTLVEFRTLMVKRPLIATVEKLLQPIRSHTRNAIITGYTHPPYKEMITNLLKTSGKFTDFLVIRGQEGSPQLPIDRRAPYVAHANGETTTDFIRPTDLEVEASPPCHPELVSGSPNQRDCCNLGEEILKQVQDDRGVEGDRVIHIQAQILYNTLAYLVLLKLETPESGLQKLKESISSGNALRHWQAGCL